MGDTERAMAWSRQWLKLSKELDSDPGRELLEKHDLSISGGPFDQDMRKRKEP
jgi:hypothetical protein